MNTAKIHVTIAGYGDIDIDSMDFDRAISRYLPASPASLRALCQERSGLTDGFTDLNDVSAFLAMLADWDQEEPFAGLGRVHAAITNALED